MRLAALSALAIGLVGALGCARTSRVYRVIAPDGAPALHVQCAREDQGRCYLLAGRACPGGYALAKAGESGFLVRCRQRAPVYAAPARYPATRLHSGYPYGASRVAHTSPPAAAPTPSPETRTAPESWPAGSTAAPAPSASPPSAALDPLIKYPWPPEEDIGY